MDVPHKKLRLKFPSLSVKYTVDFAFKIRSNATHQQLPFLFLVLSFPRLLLPLKSRKPSLGLVVGFLRERAWCCTQYKWLSLVFSDLRPPLLLLKLPAQTSLLHRPIDSRYLLLFLLSTLSFWKSVTRTLFELDFGFWLLREKKKVELKLDIEIVIHEKIK